MFLTANVMSNADGVSDFYMNQFIQAGLCGLDLRGKSMN